jgi:hypothetical protein
MIPRPGQSENELAVAAGDLNGSFVGEVFGYNFLDRVLYAKVASIEVEENLVRIYLADRITEIHGDRLKRIGTTSIELKPAETLYFLDLEADDGLS